MGGVTESLASKSLPSHFQLLHCMAKMLTTCWDKVRKYLDMMDIQDLHSPLPLSSTSSSSSSSFEPNLHPLPIGSQRWQVCEKTTKQILSVIMPTTDSDNRRKEVVEYLQRLIGEASGVKVFPFGSVPLKTYLPHGDVDLAAVNYSATSQDLAAEICTLLGNEEENNVDIPVRNVLCVPAQVRVVKCTVGDIPVDISFNQTAGLSALYFLEQVDQFIGKDHLFKRSVILIKAWCYYESRLLGGVHGLISTYALETMVLHVINLFHSSVHCPLAVLYKFLEYYSTFDWNKYCVGINGLVSLSSLPAIVVKPLCESDELLLTDEFLRRSREAFLTPTGVVGPNKPEFPIKFLNILDPLKDDNNLGRSVSRGNFYRIKSALSYGTQKLSDVLMQPPEKIGVGLEKFFKNTLERNGKGTRVDVLVPVPAYGTESYEIPAALSDSDNLLADIQFGLWSDDYGVLYPVRPTTSTTRQVWNNGWEDMGHNMQFDQNLYYNVDESPPCSVDSPIRLRLNSTVNVDEKRMPRGKPCYADNTRGLQPKNRAYIEDNWQSPRGHRLNNAAPVEDSWKTRGTSCWADSPRNLRLNNAASVEENVKSRAAPCSSDNALDFRVNNAVPAEVNWNAIGAPYSHDSPRGLLGDNGASDEVNWKSRGTCAFIPHFEQLQKRNISMEECKEDESETEQESKKDDDIGKVVDVKDSEACTPIKANLSSDTEETGCAFGFSLEEFPLLPGCKPIPVKVCPSAYLKHEEVKETSAALDSIDFGNLKPSSPKSVTLSETGKQSDSDGSVILDLPSDSTVTVEEDKDSSKSEEKLVVPVQPLQLADEKEFPALGRPDKPVITLNKKEFPPLSACLRSQKKYKWKNNLKEVQKGI